MYVCMSVCMSFDPQTPHATPRVLALHFSLQIIVSFFFLLAPLSEAPDLVFGLRDLSPPPPSGGAGKTRSGSDSRKPRTRPGSAIAASAAIPASDAHHGRAATLEYHA